MATKEVEDLDRILSEIEPDHIPPEFVTAAKITDFDGNSYIITKDELDDIMLDEEGLDDQGIQEIRLILNLELVRDAITAYSEIILKSVPL